MSTEAEVQIQPQYVVSQTVWDQTSANYDSQRRLRTLVVHPATTVGEIMEWSKFTGLGCGDVTITVAEVKR